ncbi:hypothetical protein [Streptomyces sp. WAC01280]|uniref:hypothetical protein n=1 Tax=Streptomyces sp. WAC01280 TaxID=2487424 RepID=UPI000F78EC60|nr:hypothetical protein [Streptomyces sp. WAC01280]RSS57373.1 hypothetical protein EF909_15450 [Streptomyces sp. WAC01280]
MWRNCSNCQALFYAGYYGDHEDYDMGKCPQGGMHKPAGPQFTLGETSVPFFSTQTDWRRCIYCYVLYFSGHPDIPPNYGEDGACPARPGHGHVHGDPAPNYVLLHGLGEGDHLQSNWRNCWNCQALFFGGFIYQSVCPKGGGDHFSPIDLDSTLNFCLSYPMKPRIDGENIGSSNIRIHGWDFTMEGGVDIAWAVFRNPNDPVVYSEDSIRLDRAMAYFEYTFHIPEAGWNFVNVRAWDSNSNGTPANPLSINH